MPELRQFEAVIFDMDGLLLDTERIALSAFNETCEHFGLGNETEIFMRCVGTNSELGEAVLKQGFSGKIDHLDFARIWDANYLERTTNSPIPLKNGATELLARLTALAIPIAVATSTSSDRARQKLRSAGILTHFTAVIGGDQVTNSKPHPDIYANAADVLGVTPAKCIALEDSENGVRSATSAGVTVIQIPDLVQPTQALRSLGHIILNSLRDVRTYAFQEENQGN